MAAVSSVSTFEPRAFERFLLEPMYTTVTVRRAEDMSLRTHDGHAYDISEAGVRIELDEPLAVGEQVAMTLGLPGEKRAICVSGRVVWVHDELDDAAARRLAVVFTRFGSPQDHARLVGHLGNTWHRRSA